MRSTITKAFAITFFLGGLGLSARAQINPANQILWPASCSTSGLSYMPHTNACGSFLVAVTVAGLPSAASAANQVWLVKDGSTATDCTVGGSTNPVECYSNGTTWAAYGGGGGSISPCTITSGNFACPGYAAFGSSPPTSACSAATGAICGNETSVDITPTSSVWGIQGKLATHHLQFTLNGGALQDFTLVTINGGATVPDPNFNGTTPAAGTNGYNLTFQQSGNNISGEIVGDGNTAHFFRGDGAFASPSSGGPVNITGSLTVTGCTVTSGACVTSSSPSSLIFDSISGGYTNLRILISGIGSAAAGEALRVQMNADTSGGDYASSAIWMTSSSGAATGGQAGSANSWQVGQFYNGSIPSSSDFVIFDYAGTALDKSFNGTAQEWLSSYSQVTTVSGAWGQSAAITKLTFTLASGTFGNGTKVQIWAY